MSLVIKRDSVTTLALQTVKALIGVTVYNRHSGIPCDVPICVAPGSGP
ncbi:MAG: hypothetical protein ACPG3V_03165 [Porticoccaceae bacterium]|jgi:hypothetical protein